MKINLIALFALFCVQMMAQKGGVTVKQYPNTSLQSILPIKTIVQNQNGTLLFSNEQNRSILYDGFGWSLAESLEKKTTDDEASKKIAKQVGDSVACVLFQSKSKWIVALQNGVLLKGSIKGLDTLPCSATEYFRNFGISCGVALPNKQIAIGTKQGGVLVIDAATGETVDQISIQTGLDDDRVTALAYDPTGGLWIATALGINCAAIDLPMRNFSIYPGIEGIINDLIVYNDTLFVATTKGVYRLIEASSPDQTMPFLKREIRHKEQLTYIRSTKEISKLVRISFVNKSDNTQKDISQEIPIRIEVPYDSVVNNYGVEFSSMDARRLYAKTHLAWRFEKLTALLGDAKQLIVADSAIIAACSDGLYEIKHNTVHQLVGSVSISGVVLLNNKILVAIGNVGLSSFAKTNKGWQKMNDCLSIQGNCSFVSSISDNQLWLATEKTQYRVTLDTAGVFTKVETFMSANLQNPVLLRNAPIEVACSEKGIFRYDEKKAGFVLQTQAIGLVIAHQNGFVWQQTNNRWTAQSTNTIDSTQSRLLSLLSPKQIYFNQQLWSVSGGEIYRLAAGFKEQLARVFLTSAIDRNSKSILGGELVLDESNNGLSFSWASNWHIAEEKTQYRYRILGLDQRWSQWSNTPSVTYPFLPAGQYKIELQAQTALGTIISSSAIKLTVTGNFLTHYGQLIITAFLAILCLILVLWIVRIKKKVKDSE